MGVVVIEDSPSKNLVIYLRNASILEAILGALFFLYSPPATFFILFLMFPVTVLFWYYYHSMSPLRVECSQGDGDFLIVSKRSKEIWGTLNEHSMDNHWFEPVITRIWIKFSV